MEDKITLGQFKNLSYIKNFDIHNIYITALMPKKCFIHDMAVKFNNSGMTIRGIDLIDYHDKAIGGNSDFEITAEDINELVEKSGIFPENEVFPTKNSVLIKNVINYYDITDDVQIRAINFDKNHLEMQIICLKDDHTLIR